MGQQFEQATDHDFAAKVLSESFKAVLVDFWGVSCAPCVTLDKTLDAMAPEFAARLKVVKVDVEAAPDTAATYGARSLPLLLVFRAGKEVDRVIGNPGPARLRALLTKHASG